MLSFLKSIFGSTEKPTEAKVEVSTTAAVTDKVEVAKEQPVKKASKPKVVANATTRKKKANGNRKS